MLVVRAYQSCRQTQDGQQGAGRGKGGILAASCLLPHLHICSCDVISQDLGDNRLLLLTLTNVSPKHERNTR